MLAHSSGMIGLPLRLLGARGLQQDRRPRSARDTVALITGEEKIKPADPRYWVSHRRGHAARSRRRPSSPSTKSSSRADPERGHVFTDRLLHAPRPRRDAAARRRDHAADAIERAAARRQLSSPGRACRKLTYAGDRRRSRACRAARAIVAFSADEVYAIAELIRRQRGGAAVVLGALVAAHAQRPGGALPVGRRRLSWSPPTRSAWASISTSITSPSPSDRKFDGYQFRDLTPSGTRPDRRPRRPRHMHDGTFGTTGALRAVRAGTGATRWKTIPSSRVKMLQWRNPDLDFSSLGALAGVAGGAAAA
ncbi:MAG: hypothetical protein MZV49_15810 [Rhodopseudomonas palustris]|nr:hypothetical protein [Rhodopseudomonas palustris]